MVWPTQVWNLRTIMIRFISRIFSDGQDQLVIMNRWHGFQASIRLRKQALYATDADTYYDNYLVENFEGIEDMDRRVLLQSGYIEDKGYYTIPLRNQQIVEGGERFAVIVQIYTKGSSHPVAIEYASNKLTSAADITDGESYMSYNGNLWSHMETASACNACLKVYTDDAE